MGETKGKLIICDRCQEGSVFLKFLGAGPGYIDKFEDKPKNWIHDTRFGYLCPECAKEFVSIMKDFFGDYKYSGIAPCWHIEDE